MTRRDRSSFALCALAIAASVFAIGGATRWAQATVAAIAAAALAFAVLSRRRFQRRSPLLLLLFAACGWSFIQWVPLPSGVTAALSPTLDALRSEGAVLAGVTPRASLSVDPPATLRALTFLITLSALAVVTLRLAVSERGRYWLVASVATVAGAAALVAGLHELAGATQLYGVYKPRQAPPILGSLINPNHFGCLMAIGAITSSGLAFYAKQHALLRVGWVVNGGLCLVVTLATYSRGAVLGLAVGASATLAALVAQKIYASELTASRRRRERFFRTTLPIGVTVVCALFLAVFLSGGSVVGQLQSTSLDELQAPRTKYAAWVSSLELVRESPWVGVGRGAFESAFTRVHPASAYATFTHPENTVVQAVVEWGIPASLALAVIAGWMTLLALRRWRDGPLAAGAIGALLAVGFQSNFDFGVELLGVAAPAVALVATLTYVPLIEVAPERLRRSMLARLAHVSLVVVAAVILFTQMTRTLAEDHELLAAQPSASEVAESIQAHPLDYLGYAVLAAQRFNANDPGAIRILNHALRLHPTHSDLHWIAARLLVRTNRLSQAEAEYSTAVRYTSNPRPIVAELVRVLPADRAARAIPFEMSIERMLRELPTDIATRWLTLVFEHTHDVRAADALYNHGLRTKSWGLAAQGARYRCELMPSTRCTVELATVLSRAGHHAEVIDLVRTVAEWQGRREDQLRAWEMLCESHAALGNTSEAASCRRRLEASGLKPLEP